MKLKWALLAVGVAAILVFANLDQIVGGREALDKVSPTWDIVLLTVSISAFVLLIALFGKERD
jgi:hypothetical protein